MERPDPLPLLNAALQAGTFTEKEYEDRYARLNRQHGKRCACGGQVVYSHVDGRDLCGDCALEDINGKETCMSLVFLGGTAANNPWREQFIADLVARGVDSTALFNPVVADWDEKAQAREEEAKAQATHHVYYIADPMQEGNPLSAYSMVEATMALYDRPDTTVIIFDTAGMGGHPLKAMNQAARVLVQRHPNANIFTSVELAKQWLVDQL